MKKIIKHNEAGFSLVELMVVVVILGILLSISIPVFMASIARAHQRTCLENINMVERSWEQYRGENAEDGIPDPTDYDTDLLPMIPIYFKTLPLCPLGGTYKVISGNPLRIECSLHGSLDHPREP